MKRNETLLAGLYRIGKLPAEGSDEHNTFALQDFDVLLQRFETPVTVGEAIQLIGLSPPAGSGAYGVEWALIHLIETVAIVELQQVLDASGENEVKRIVQKRLDNYLKKQTGS